MLGSMKVQIGCPLLLVTILSSCTAGQNVEPSPTARPTSTATAELSPSPTPTSITSPSPPGFARHDILQVVTTDLVVRSAPGTGADSEIHPLRISSPTMLYVFDGPVHADGYDRYLVLPSTHSYEPSGLVVGWVAAAGKDGEGWIGQPSVDCPDSNLEEIAAASEVVRLVCFGGQTLTLEGELLGCLERDPAASPAMIWQNRCGLMRFDCCPDVVPFPSGIGIWFDGDIGPTSYAQPLSVAVDGHFADPGANSCPDIAGGEGWSDARLAFQADPPPGWGTFLCRVEFVATKIRRIAS
jgi:hypothetical protein